MKFLATGVILSFSLFYRVASNSAPSPTIKAIPAPLVESTASRFVYLEQSKVTVTCSFRIDPLPEGVELELLYHVAVYNPVFGSDGLPDVERVSKDELEVQYWPNVFVPLLSFTCTATNRTGTNSQLLSTSTLEIEQLYKTDFVNIQGSSKHTTVESGDELELKCLGDGNPLPRQYQWYNRTKDGDVELSNETRRSLQFVAPIYWPGQSVIVCGTKNQFNKEVVKSAIITVTSLFFPWPAFKVTPSPTNMSTSEKLVFMEKLTVSIECYLPLTTMPPEISLKIVLQSYEPNPVYPGERLSYTVYRQSLWDINYRREAFITIVNIACLAINRTTGQTKKTSQIIIEQQYRTMSAKVQSSDGKDELRVDAGETVRLECLADGNPKPEYRWYNSTEMYSENRLEGETEQILEFVTPSNWSTGSWYFCEAKNKFNGNFIKARRISVTSVYIPPPVLELTPSPTDLSTSKKLVFLEEPKVTVKCSLPTDTFRKDVYVKMVLVDREPNPVYTQETGRITPSPDRSQMDIEYNPERFIPLLNLSCNAVDRVTGLTKKSNNILVEQQYKTMNVIVGGLEKIMVIGGKTALLECLADGNPEPEYQWYKKTENSEAFKLRNENQGILEVVTPMNESTTGLYICGAKNKLNRFMMRAKPVTVTSHPLPYPIMDATPTPRKESSDGKFVYLEQRYVNVTCIFPITPLAEHVDLRRKTRIAVYNPVFEPNGKPTTKGHYWPLSIEYQQDLFVPLMSLVCIARKTNATHTIVLSTSTLQIEQLHRTQNIRVYGPFNAAVENQGILRCVADGNPPPQYQWFHETRDGFVALPSANTSILELVATPDVE